MVWVTSLLQDFANIYINLAGSEERASLQNRK
jgi:hypothetical protein